MLLSTIETAVGDKARNASINTTMLQRWINNGYHDIVNKIMSIHEDYYGSSSTIAVTADTQEFNLPTDFRKFIKITDENDNKLYRVNVDDADADVAGYYLYGSKIGFKPIPTADATYPIWFIKQPTDLVNNGNGADDTPDLPTHYHHLLVLYALKEYYEYEQEDSKAKFYFDEYKVTLAEMLQELKLRNIDEPKTVENRHRKYDDYEWED